jgi:acylphosphatase
MSYDESGHCQDRIEQMIQTQAELTRRATGAVTVQAFFTEEERQKFKTICNDAGSNMAHVLRILALKWMEEKGGAS